MAKYLVQRQNILTEISLQKHPQQKYLQQKYLWPKYPQYKYIPTAKISFAQKYPQQKCLQPKYPQCKNIFRTKISSGPKYPHSKNILTAKITSEPKYPQLKNVFSAKKYQLQYILNERCDCYNIGNLDINQKILYWLLILEIDKIIANFDYLSQSTNVFCYINKIIRK